MNEYDFRSLNDKEFEALSRDLLQCELKITLESFKAGKDKGIDLRFCNSVDGKKIIVQAKHWSRSGWSMLYNHLEKSELKKVKLLNPDRYLLVTSVELSPQNKEDLVKLFSPFIKNTSDILGKEDLNNLLGKFKAIEEKHYKLWLSSTTILKKIITNGVQGRSEFIAKTINRNIRIYVSGDKHQKALTILNKERFLIIIGEPGIGKTSLARMIVYELLGNDYQLVVIEDIKDAESLWQPDTKQIFYFDDFLGSNYLELASSKNSDSNLINFIKRVKDDPTKRLILTCRTTILNQAVDKLSKLQDPLVDIARHEVKVQDYNKFDKALILYNHLYFNELSEEYYEKITENKNYLKIITHKNFNPRIIEFITDPLRLRSVDLDKYLEFIFNNLEQPHLIWKHPYEHQIDDYSRFLLTTLFSLDKPRENILQKAFEARMNYEIENGNFLRINNCFSTKVRELLGGFISASRNEVFAEYNFFNPSIADFLIDYLNRNPSEKWRILDSAVFIEQYTWRFKRSTFQTSINFTHDELMRLYKSVLKNESELELLATGSKEFGLLNFYYSFFDLDLIKDDVARHFNAIDWYKISSTQTIDLVYLMEELSIHNWSKEVVSNKWNQVVECLFRNAEEEKDFIQIKDFFDSYGKDYNLFLEEPGNKDLVTRHLERYWKSKIEDIELNNEYVTSYTSEQKLKVYLDELYVDGISFNENFGIITNILDRINDIDATEIAESNKQKAEEEDYVNDIQEEEWKFSRHEEKELNEKIIDLFESK